mgnify:CR=1 FL=1
MDHFQLGRVAFEARQFTEAEGHLKRAEPTVTPEEFLELRELQFSCAKILRPETSWVELKVLLSLHAEKDAPDVLLDFLHRHESHFPATQKSLFFELHAQAYFQKGELSRSREYATFHVEYLLTKKLSAHLATVSAKYEAWFPQSFYFSYMHYQAYILHEDVSSATLQLSRLSKLIQRKWAKIEDKKENSKHSVLASVADCTRGLEFTNGESVLLSHRAHLNALLQGPDALQKEDWKKVVELVIHDANWDNLKLCLEIAIKCEAKEIALETYACLKRKRGFSFVKLTRHDSPLKEWLLDNAGVRQSRPGGDSPAERISEEDLKLTDSIKDADQGIGLPAENEDSEELKAVEMNAIRQLSLHGPGIELLPDLLVAYRTMGFHRVVNWLLQSFSLEGVGVDLRRKIQYFKVLHAVDMKENYLGLALIEEMLGDVDLAMDEFKELKYAQGCLYMGLARFAEARQSFQSVQKVDPGYRQIRERMSKIAQG